MWRHGFRSLSDVDTVRGVEHVAVDNSFGWAVSRSCGRTRTVSGLLPLACCCIVGFNAKAPNMRLKTWWQQQFNQLGVWLPPSLLKDIYYRRHGIADST